MINTGDSKYNSDDVKKLIESLRDGCNLFTEIIGSIVEWCNTFVKPMTQFFQEISKTLDAGIKNIIKPANAISILGKHQYIQWEHMSDDFIDNIVKTDNVDKYLRLKYEKEGYQSFFEVADLCIESDAVGYNKKVLCQAVNAFKNRDYDLSAIGIVVVIDGTLSRITGNPSHKISERVKSLLDEIDDDEEISNEDYVLISLYLSLFKTIESFTASIKFDMNEPKGLNRHWMLHGRSNRKRTKLDCVKLMRFLYAVILLSEIEKTV